MSVLVYSHIHCISSYLHVFHWHIKTFLSRIHLYFTQRKSCSLYRFLTRKHVDYLPSIYYLDSLLSYHNLLLPLVLACSLCNKTTPMLHILGNVFEKNNWTNIDIMLFYFFAIRQCFCSLFYLAPFITATIKLKVKT